MINQDDQITLTFIKLEIISSLIAIIGLSFFIVASFQSKNIILLSYYTRDSSRQNRSPDIVTLIGRIVLDSGAFIAAITTSMRLIQRTQKLIRKESVVGSNIPIVFVTLGSWLTFAGGIVALVGDYRRAQETPSPIPIY